MAPHGMIAVGGKDCLFYAIVLNPTGDPVPELSRGDILKTLPRERDPQQRVYSKFIERKEDSHGTPLSITFKKIQSTLTSHLISLTKLQKNHPISFAMLHIGRDKTERRFSFEDMRKNSNRAANYFKSLGIKTRGQSYAYSRQKL